MTDGDFKDLSRRRFKLLIKYGVIQHLIFLTTGNMINVNADLLQWSITFLLKKLLVVVLKWEIFRTSVLQTQLRENQLENYTTELLEHLTKEKDTHFLQTIFGVLIQPIWNYEANLINKFVFICVNDIFGKYVWVIPSRIKKVLQLILGR